MNIAYSSALANLKSNALSYWSPADRHRVDESFAMSRIHSDFSNIQPPDGFKIAKDANLFCIGSCFAREIEDAIESAGLSSSTKSQFLDIIEKNPDLFEKKSDTLVGRPTAFLNRYNLGSMNDLLNDIADESNINTELLYSSCNELFYDYKYTRFLKPLPLIKCLKRREVIRETYRHAAETSNVFIFTFGLCEAFYDQDSSKYLNIMPDPKSAKNHNITFRFLSFEDNINLGRQVVNTVRKIQPDSLIILTVSPVPLDATFTKYDIIVANSLAKSTLVLTAHQLAGEFPDVHYFPSYEMVVNSEQSTAWLWDKKHVSENMVKHIMHTFIANYVST